MNSVSPAIERKRVSSKETSQAILQSAEPFISPTNPTGRRLQRRSIGLF